MRVALSVEQLYRPQPGGVATYVRGLLRGLAELGDEASVVTLAPSGQDLSELAGLVPGGGVVETPYSLRALTALWWRRPLGVPDDVDVVHATTLAGPFAGGAKGARHSVALHDLMWRDRPADATKRGVRFHERRLRAVLAREEIRLVVTSPPLVERLADLGVARERVFAARLGRDEGEAAEPARVASLLATHGVSGPFTLYAGTREPRKNLTRLVAAHRAAREEEPALGPLVVVGPGGWGAEADLTDAVVLGGVDRDVLLGLMAAARVLAYVAFDEGWGLPPVEALGLGTAVVAGSKVPSVAGNAEAVLVEATDVEDIAAGLVRAARASDDEATRAARVASVAALTWRQCALDHLVAWR